MKLQLVLLTIGLITAWLPSGLGATKVRIRAYRAAGEVDTLPRTDNTEVAITLGTRLLLICDVTGLSEKNAVVSYKWFWSCVGGNQGRCEIRDRDPYYRLVNDTLLVDVTSLDHGKRYYCVVRVSNASALSTGFTAILTMDGNPTSFLYTPTSLLPEHSVLTDVQQATGRNGQQWITCRSGGEGTRPEIWMGSEPIPSTGTANSATIGLGTQHPNGLYHCLTAQSQREYFSLFLNNSVTLAAPTISGRDTSMWTLTSPDGSRVERYIVELKCRVRKIIFVEKYMSVNASGGTGRVATSVSCFGGLGQLYRVKVWAVSGPNISPIPVCVTGGQCREEGIAPATAVNTETPATLATVVNTATVTTPTTAVNTATPTTTTIATSTTTPTTRTTAVNTATPTTPTNAVNTATVTTPTIAINTATPTTRTTAANTATPTTPTTAVNIATPSGPQPSSTGEQPTISAFIGAGIGVSIFLLLVLLIVVVLIVVVVVVSRKAACKAKRDVIVNDNPYYNNTVVVLQELEMQGVGADQNDAHSCQGVGNNQGEGEDLLNFDVGYNPYEVVNREALGKNTMTPTPKVSSTAASATKVDAVYAVVDKSKKKGAKKKTEVESTVVNKEDLYALPMRKAVKMTDEGGGVVVSGGVEEGGHYDDVVELIIADRIP